MKSHYLWALTALLLSTSCTSGKLDVRSVDYQAIRTDYAQPTSIPEDATIAVEYFFNEKGEMQPVVYNLTSEILTVDQTKSFVIKPDGSSVSYYDPTIRTTTTGSFNAETDGSSFNLGGIASILGIGGPLGGLMGSTTISSATTNGLIRQNTVSITDQPMVNIGPKGSIAMSKAFAIPVIGKAGFTSKYDFIDINPKNALNQFSVCITYSTDDGNTFDKIVTHFYISSQISVPVNDHKVSQSFYSIYDKKPDALAENMFMFLMPNNIASETTNVMGEFITHTNNHDLYIHGSLIDYK